MGLFNGGRLTYPEQFVSAVVHRAGPERGDDFLSQEQPPVCVDDVRTFFVGLWDSPGR